MRHIVNIGLLLSFSTLAISGVLSFTEPFSLNTARLHIVFGLVTMVLVGLHLTSRVTYYKKQLFASTDKGSKVPKWQLLLILIVWSGLLAVSFYNLPPASNLVGLSYEARHRTDIVRSSDMAAFLDVGHTRLVSRSKPTDSSASKTSGEAPEDSNNQDLKKIRYASISMMVKFNSELKVKPNIAIWAESTTGSMIETLFLDHQLTFQKTPNWGGKPTPRHTILPIWRHRYTLLTGIKPTGEIDAFTGATATHTFSLNDYLKLGEASEFVLAIEVNVPNDANSVYKDETLGQPSLLYTAYIDVDGEQPYKLLELTGHGGTGENPGAIHYDLENFTTAKQLMDLMLVKVEFDERRVTQN